MFGVSIHTVSEFEAFHCHVLLATKPSEELHTTLHVDSLLIVESAFGNSFLNISHQASGR